MDLERLDTTANTSGTRGHHGLYFDVVAKSNIGAQIAIHKFATKLGQPNQAATVTIYACSEAFAGNTNTESAAKWSKVGCGSISDSLTEISLTSPVALVDAQKKGFYFHCPDNYISFRAPTQGSVSVASNNWLDIYSGPFSTAPTAFASVNRQHHGMYGVVIFSVLPHPEQLSNKRRIVMQEALWTDTSFSDCTIKCGTRVLKCHRVVLGTASPVWSTALRSSFREGSEASISIDDFDPSVVEAAVKYAYTSDIPADGNIDLIDCLKLAHRYEMSSLVEACAHHVINNLTVDNVAKAVAVMNVLSDNKSVKSLWPILFERVRENEFLNKAALRSLRQVT